MMAAAEIIAIVNSFFILIKILLRLFPNIISDMY